ncbi:MAG: carbohydrate kinase family protein [Anaerolineae bacterium]|nr:carbohydrate kinase family protein [Anaerolineae bacterium]
MNDNLDVVGLGYCAYDILAIVPRLPDFDDVQMVHLDDLVYDGGGPVGTTLAALARLGARPGYVGVLGDDAEGRWLRDLFVQEGVDVSRLRLEGGVGTNRCLILVHQATGGRAILCQPRVEAADLVLDDADRAYIRAARALHLDGQFLPAAVQAARWARQAGVKVCFDGNHPRPGLEELLPLVDWLVVSEQFPVAYTGRSGLEDAARSLLALGPAVVVVTQGERGCQAWTADGHWRIPACPVQAVDTTGAGDAFHGGFIYAMLQGWELPRAAAFANAVAAFNCRTLGGRRGLPTLDDVAPLLTAPS